MEETYLVEIRLARTKWRVKETVFAIARRFRLEQWMERHPHVTLYGPLILNEGTSPEQVLEAISRVASGYDPVPFAIQGWEKKEGMHGSVIAFSVRPSDELHTLAYAINSALAPHVHSLNAWDARPDMKWFHVTIVNQLDEKRAQQVFSRISMRVSGVPDKTGIRGLLSSVCRFLGHRIFGRRDVLPRSLLLDETGLRITVMQGMEIFAEYDFLLKRWITGSDIHDAACWQKTLKNFRCHAGFEINNAPVSPPGEIFLMADLHLGHANSIRYCSRPFLFSDVGEMDRVLVQNWNSTIPPENQAYFLGDLRYGRNAPPAAYYLGQLNGRITLIAGNHDADVDGTVPTFTLEHGGFRFLLVHDPADVPAGYDGWVIHGHHHNNNPEEYPFISFTKKRINVSAEVVGYVPVPLSELCQRIHAARDNGDLPPVLLRYPYIA